MALSIETLSLSGVWKSLKYPWVAATPAIRTATSGPRGCKRKEQKLYFAQLFCTIANENGFNCLFKAR